jgi:hypothetical protein
MEKYSFITTKPRYIVLKARNKKIEKLILLKSVPFDDDNLSPSIYL